MLTTIGKLVTLAGWAAIIYNVIAPYTGEWLNYVGILLLVAHVIECMIFADKIKTHHADNLAAGYLQVLIFGAVHASQLK